MKKVFIVLTVLLVVAFPAFSASNGMEIDVNGYAGGNGLQFAFGSNDPSFSLSFQPGVDMYFDGLNGLDLRVSLGFSKDLTGLGIDVGYARLFPLDGGITLSIKAGFSWVAALMDGANAHSIGLFASLDACYDIYKDLYVMVGLRDTMTFATFVNTDFGNTTNNGFNNTFMLPTVGFGWKF